ncbi:integrase catalytic domain-containing protein [Trichonephila clavipes]|nr:integrase catalytic domain-containing protein [Trichonephila clavipes]
MSLFPSTPQDRTKNKGSYFPGQRMKPNRVHFRPHSFPTLLEKVELRSRKCLYCNKGHELDACRSVSANEKREILRKKGCCYLCLSPGHREMECVKRESCPICNGSHHFSICFRNRHDDDLSPKRDTDNIVSAVIKTEVNSVLLQTCAALIDVKNEQEVVRLFLDNGSQRSFVLKSTSEKFNFPILRKENLSICTFGAKETETKTLNIVKIKLKNRDDPNLCIEIEAVETEHISITNLPTPDRNIDKKFRYLKNVQLADPYEFNDKEISILIGADYYYQVVTGLDWDDKLPKQLEVSWNKWCNEIHYLSEIKISRYYFQNFLPSNATTIQLHCFSDASKKAYGTVAYLRIELNDGNIISSFVASKGRVAPLKTLSIPRLELMGALLSARLCDKIATALILPVSRFYWIDSSITCYWIKGDFNKHKVFV